MSCTNPPPDPAAAPGSGCDTTIDRRDFLCSVAACAAALAGACSDPTHTAFFRQHLRELSREEIAKMLAGLEQEYTAKYGKPVAVGIDPPQPGVEFGYALDIGRCVGCRRCVHACVKENNQGREPEIQWIKVLQMDDDKGVDFAHADPYYDSQQVPQPGHFYLPMACMHCRNAPCVKSCPVGATWQEPDGIVVIDYDWCIGCRCCMAACPYGARRFNWTEPELPAEQMNPKTHYLGNRPRTRGVVEKCTFCIHRVRKGLFPACVEACPVGARKFGNLRDPNSEIRYVLEHKRVFVLKGEFNTQPRFYYYFG
jgi:molybdopterin-containing oxidoreductase family iron-sulfur binding subunit